MTRPAPPGRVDSFPEAPEPAVPQTAADPQALVRPRDLHGTQRRAADLEVAAATGAGVLAAETAARVQETHRAIADRVFSMQSPAAAPVKVAHDAISAGVYAAVRGGGRLAGLGLAAAARARPRGEEAPLDERSPFAALALAATNGLYGDQLEADGLGALATEPAVRVDGRAVAPTTAALAEAFPDRTNRLVVLTHGLCETEHAWELFAGRRGRTYLDAFRALGWTPVTVRLNSGRHISENGRDLSVLLEEVVAAWPVDVAELALIGHSMGGLIGRSAAHVAVAEGREWVDLVRTTVSLGTPHGGAALEQQVTKLIRRIRSLPEAAALVNVLEARSAGIRDLRFGSLVDEDWRDRTDEELFEDLCAEVPLQDGPRHYAVAATLTRDPRHPVSRVLGDLLVLEASARGLGRRTVGFAEDDVVHLGGATHFALLNHPRIEALLVEWLGGDVLDAEPSAGERAAVAAAGD